MITLTILLLLLSITARAVPTPFAPPHGSISPVIPAQIVSRSECDKTVGRPGGVYICSQTNFKGDCNWFPPTMNCHTFDGNPNKRPRSFGPDAATRCHFYVSNDCSGKRVPAVYYKDKGE
ncbi:Nn.00g079160.m01.CDS01 [Neocucurbitaria sp. VM-36]